MKIGDAKLPGFDFQQRVMPAGLHTGVHFGEMLQPGSIWALRMTTLDHRIVAGKQANQRRPRVMIAEDNRTIQELIALCLRDSCDLILASNGSECWQLMQSSPPDALITDIMMPGDMDGNALIEAIKKTPALQSTPVLVISACSQQNDIDETMRLGADAYMTKPFSPFKLIGWVGQHLTPN